MKLNYSEVMAQRTDAEILDILTNGNDEYLPEALAEAQSEFKRRNLTVNQIESAKQILEHNAIEIAAKAEATLELKWKITTFLFPKPANLLIAKTFKAEGHKRKHDEAIKWTIYGMLFYVTMILLLFALTRLGLF